MVDIVGLLPLTLGGVITTLVNALLAFVVLLAADKVVAHNQEPKKTLIVSLVALFITPVIGAYAASFATLPDFVFSYLLPLFVWIILGELLLEGDYRTKLKVVGIAFIAYIVLSFTVGPILLSTISGLLPV